MRGALAILRPAAVQVTNTTRGEIHMQFRTHIDYAPGPALQEALRDALAQHKLVHLRRVPDDVDLGKLYYELGSALGDFLFKDEDPNTANLESIGWLEMSYNADKAETHTYRHGNGQMHLHIDGSYSDENFDVIFLFCARRADFGGASTFIDGQDVVRYLKIVDSALLDQLLSTEVLFEKGNKSKVSPIISYENGLPVFNWNVSRVAKSNPSPVLDMVDRFQTFCHQRLVSGGVLTYCLMEKGEGVFFHDRLLLHGRNSFWGNRCLKKGAVRSNLPKELADVDVASVTAVAD